MDKYCIWCDKPIIGERKNNKMYCSDICHAERVTANTKNEGLGPKDYKDHPNRAREQGLPEGGLPWEVQCTLDLEENSPRITEDMYYINNCMSSLPQPKYSDGSHYVAKKTKWNFETFNGRSEKSPQEDRCGCGQLISEQTLDCYSHMTQGY
jgi:hypothetical protein|tara:strand:- start:656 stop:1111 length:456 start_codon:yes stop_codon:yes gene_type:complete